MAPFWRVVAAQPQSQQGRRVIAWAGKHSSLARVESFSYRRAI